MQHRSKSIAFQNYFQSGNSSNNGAGYINMVSLVGTNGTRRPPSQQLSFHSSNSKNHSRHQSASVPPSTPRNAYQMTEIEAPCIRKFLLCDVRFRSIGMRISPYTLWKRITLLRRRVMEVNISFAEFRTTFSHKYDTKLSRNSVSIAFCMMFIAALPLDDSELII